MTSNPQISSQSDDDWELIVDITNINPSQLGAGKYDLNTSLQSDFIAVQIEAGNQQPNWVNGGYINQVYQFTDFIVTSAQHFLAVNQVNLIKLDSLAPIAFGLAYDPPKYFQNVSIKVWKYTGTQTDLLLQDIANGLQNISVVAQVDFSELSVKLDQILNNQSQNQPVDLTQVYDGLDSLTQKQLTIEATLQAILDKLDNIECSGGNDDTDEVTPTVSEQEFFFLQ